MTEPESGGTQNDPGSADGSTSQDPGVTDWPPDADIPEKEKRGPEPKRADPDGGFTKELEQAVEELISHGAENPEEAAILMTRLLMIRSHAGPLPSPEDLAAHELAYPGAAAEILAGASENRDHRFAMDRKTANTARISLFATTGVILSLIVAGVVVGLAGEPALGAMFGAGGITPIAYAMIKGGGVWTGRSQ